MCYKNKHENEAKIQNSPLFCNWQNLFEELYLYVVDGLTVASEQVVVAPGHVVVQHGASQSKVVGQDASVGENSS